VSYCLIFEWHGKDIGVAIFSNVGLCPSEGSRLKIILHSGSSTLHGLRRFQKAEALHFGSHRYHFTAPRSRPFLEAVWRSRSRSLWTEWMLTANPKSTPNNNSLKLFEPT
jgi:hypothetical protein